MGMFGGGDDDSGANDAINQQISQSEQELESKRQNLYETRLGIIKAQGAETWTPDRSAAVGNFGLGKR